MRSRLLAAATAALLGVTFGAGVSPAEAGHGSGSGIGNPDNVDHYIDRNSITADTEISVAHGIAQLNRSVMNATLTGTGDVEVWDNFYGTEEPWDRVAGYADCPIPAGGGLCDRYRLRFNLSYQAGQSVAVLRSAGCHEFGHTAGLGHRLPSGDTDNNSCMQGSFSAARPNYDAHDIAAINNIF